MAITVYWGSCDASATVRIGADAQFITASDEDYILRLYDSRQPGLPSFSLDLSTFLEAKDSTKEPDIQEGRPGLEIACTGLRLTVGIEAVSSRRVGSATLRDV